MKRFNLFILLYCFVIPCLAQQAPDSTGRIYNLGEVLVSAKIQRFSVNSEEIKKFNSLDVARSLRILPSVNIGSFGSRNESTLYLRGFDIRSVPVYIDGIPVYVPYDGYVDLARFTTFDIARIDISKGFSSVTFGPNTLGGVINLISMKPVQKFELEAGSGLMSGKGREYRINLGSNFGKFYIETGLSSIQKENFPLSSKFITNMSEGDHIRDNSALQDTKASFKIGYTPKKGDEYSLNYLYSHGGKGNPVYAGADPGTRARFWQWPYWDKQSVYYISRTEFKKAYVLKARIYYDQFRNKLSSFDDNTYTTRNRASSFDSYYKDYTAGGNVEFSGSIMKNNSFTASFHFKNDNHNEHNNNEPERHFSDNTWSLGIEDTYDLTPKLSIIEGLSYNLRQGLAAEDYDLKLDIISRYPENNSRSLNAQAAASYRFSDNSNAAFHVSWKSRFATMKDRYSYRMGTGIPNPDLNPENALNLSITSFLRINKIIDIRPEIYLSRLYNTIQLVNNVSADLVQMQNTGNAVFSGADLEIELSLFEFMKLNTVYSYISRKNLSDPTILFTGIPDHKVFTSLEFSHNKKYNLIIFEEYGSGSYTSSDGNRYSPEYLVFNCRFSGKPTRYLSLEAGINNIFDRNYTLEEGYPEAGRNFYCGLAVTIGR
jgi:iron complex outermembrane receptor protein